MGDKSSIEWTDATWTIVQGCDYESPGCAHCYVPPMLWRMTEHGASIGILPSTGWGWKEDPDEPFHKWVLYIELPDLGPLGGQVSFHAATRGAGPDFAGDWDKLIGRGAARICQWCAAILAGEHAERAPASMSDISQPCREKSQEVWC